MGRYLRSVSLALLCLIVLAQSPAFGAMGVRENGTRKGIFNDLNFIGATVTKKSGDRSTADINIISSTLTSVGIATAGATTVSTTTLTGAASWSLFNIIISTRTFTLGNGVAGQMATLKGVDRVAGTLTIDATTKFGWSSITMDSDGEIISLLYLNDTQGWIIIGKDSATVALVNDQI